MKTIEKHPKHDMKLYKKHWILGFLMVLRILRHPGKYLIKTLWIEWFQDHLFTVGISVRTFQTWLTVTAGICSSLKQLHHGFVSVREACKNSQPVDSRHFSWNWPAYLLAICYRKWSCNKLICSSQHTSQWLLNMGHQTSPTQTTYCSGQITQVLYKHVHHSCPFFDPFQLMENLITPVIVPPTKIVLKFFYASHPQKNLWPGPRRRLRQRQDQCWNGWHVDKVGPYQLYK